MSGQPVIVFNPKNILLCIITGFLFVSNIVKADYKTVQRLYPVPEHGELVLEVPEKWEVTYFSPAENKPPVITFYQKDDKKKELFQLNLSPLWDDGFGRNITSPEQIRDFVNNVGQRVLELSDETELQLLLIQGTDGQGYFFSLTDSSAGPGEYRYLTQGALSVGEILVVFSLFTHEPDSPIYDSVMKMLQTASLRFQRHV